MSALEKAAQESKRVHVLREKTQIESTAMAHLVETCIVSLHIFLPYSIHDLCLSLSLNSVRKINIHRIFQYTENLPEGVFIGLPYWRMQELGFHPQYYRPGMK